MQLPYPSAHPFPLILAPMAGVSEAPFRQICRRMGADVVLSEFLSSEAIRRRIRTTLEGAEFEPIERPIGIQIYGADPNAMAEAAGLDHRALPARVHRHQLRLSGEEGGAAKRRLGLPPGHGPGGPHHSGGDRRHAPSGDGQDPERLERGVRDPGRRSPCGCRTPAPRAFTLHARTRTQMFSGKANWDEIARVVEALDIPVIGNGDLETAADIVRMRDHTGCAGAMIGRGAFGNPWMFRDGRALLARRAAAPAAPDAGERFSVALEHARLALRLQGDTRKTVMEFRKHLGWYTRGLHGSSALRQRLFQIESIAEAEAIFLEYLEPVAQVA